MLDRDCEIPPEQWLSDQVAVFESDEDSLVNIPKRQDGQDYTYEALYPDQQEIVMHVMAKIHKFMECEDLSEFIPQRMTINGAGGSGKSVVINTIVSMLRKMFGTNEIVKVVAPTGTAAFNVKGETFHHLCGNRVSKRHYIPNSMSKEKRINLVKKFKSLLVMIVDERSLINSCDLGTVAYQVGETIFGGGHMTQDSFGGLPVLILAGDDYQLPGTSEGAISAFFNKGGTAMTRKGRELLLECSQHVMELHGSKRMKDSEIKEKEILEKLRVGRELTDAEIQKLLSLKIDVMSKVHAPEVINRILDRAIFLFYTNNKRIRHNLQQILRHSNSTNPVAILSPTSKGPLGGKGIRAHFDSKLPEASIICKGARVAIENRNFNPQWGLHNGACGVVDEIVFQKGMSPNNGNMPLYVVVDFPMYCGPIWDRSKPTVRIVLYFTDYIIMYY